jgi:hypothetical protein
VEKIIRNDEQGLEEIDKTWWAWTDGLRRAGWNQGRKRDIRRKKMMKMRMKDNNNQYGGKKNNEDDDEDGDEDG